MHQEPAGGTERDEAAKPGRPVEPPSDRTVAVKVVVALALIVLFILFIIQNAGPVEIDFVFVRADVGLIWVFLGCAIIGGIVAWLIGRPRRRAMRKLVQEYERQRVQKKP